MESKLLFILAVCVLTVDYELNLFQAFQFYLTYDNSNKSMAEFFCNVTDYSGYESIQKR